PPTGFLRLPVTCNAYKAFRMISLRSRRSRLARVRKEGENREICLLVDTISTSSSAFFVARIHGSVTYSSRRSVGPLPCAAADRAGDCVAPHAGRVVAGPRSAAPPADSLSIPDADAARRAARRDAPAHAGRRGRFVSGWPRSVNGRVRFGVGV